MIVFITQAEAGIRFPVDFKGNTNDEVISNLDEYNKRGFFTIVFPNDEKRMYLDGKLFIEPEIIEGAYKYHKKQYIDLSAKLMDYKEVKL